MGIHDHYPPNPHAVEAESDEYDDTRDHKPCTICNKTGLCQACKGTAEVVLFTGKVECEDCHDGWCPNCDGSGWL